MVFLFKEVVFRIPCLLLVYMGPWIVQPAGQPWFFKDGYTTNGPRQHTGCKTAELRVAEWGADRFVCRRRRLGKNGCGNQFLNHRVFEWYMLKLSIWAETCWNHMNTWCTPWFRGAMGHQSCHRSRRRKRYGGLAPRKAHVESPASMNVMLGWLVKKACGRMI